MYGIESSTFTITPSQSNEVDAFRMFLENHEKKKYRPRNFSGSEHRNIRIARACKAALEFTTIQMNRRIHFILDDIDMTQVQLKTPTSSGHKSITAQELRYIYRNEIKRDFESQNFSKAQKNPKPLTMSVYGQQRCKIREKKVPEKAVSAETSAIVSAMMSLGKLIGAHGTLDAIEKDKKIVDNIVFWHGGQITVKPWDKEYGKGIWYGFYGHDYDKKITPIKTGMKKSIDTLSTLKQTPRKSKVRRGNSDNIFVVP